MTGGGPVFASRPRLVSRRHIDLRLCASALCRAAR
jgi:hypothetical protein